MNIDELKQTLTNMADEVEHTRAQARLDGIDSKAAAERRNKLLSGGAVVSVAAVALSMVGPQLVNDANNSPAGPVSNTTNSDTDKRADGKRDEDIVQTDEDVLQTDLPTVTDNGISFYTEPAGDGLLGEAVGRPGQRSVSFTATPSTTDLSWVNICSASLPERVNRIWTSVSVNGNTLGSSGCQESTGGPFQAEGSFGSSPTANQRAWEELGVVAGEPSVFSLRLKPAAEKIEELRDAQIGLAVYENTGARFEDHGLWYKRERVVDGHTYRLAGNSFSEFKGGRGEMRVPLPPAEHPLFLAFGVAKVAGPYRTFQNAEGANVSSVGGWSEGGTFARPDQDSAEMSIRTKRDDGSGLIYILAYERID